MRSILAKTFIALMIFNASLWAYFLASDDFIQTELEHLRDKLSSAGYVYADMTRQALWQTEGRPDDAPLVIRDFLVSSAALVGNNLRIYQNDHKPTLTENRVYFDARQHSAQDRIVVSRLSDGPPSGTESTGYFSHFLEQIFIIYKGLFIDIQLQEAFDGYQTRLVAQSFVTAEGPDELKVQSITPIKDGRNVVGFVELWEYYNLRSAYMKRNQGRIIGLLNLTGVTVLFGLYLVLSVIWPLRRLAANLAKRSAATNLQDELIHLENMKLQSRKDEIGRLASSLAFLNTRVLGALKDKEEFASDVSHELKNPIASILAYSEAHAADNKALPQTLEKIRKQAARMDRLVSEISDVARIDHEIVNQKRERFNLSDLLSEIAGHFSDPSQQPNLRITQNIQANVNTLGLPDRVGQVFVNLFQNAISAMDQNGHIRVTLRSDKRGIKVLIEDDGPGIPLENNERVFERFFSDRSANRPMNEHSGLGLYICRQIIEAHGGDIKVVPSSLGGAAFAMTLPRADNQNINPLNHGQKMKFALKLYILILGLSVLGLAWILSQPDLPSEEVLWCEEYRPNLSLKECAKEFAY